MKFSIARLLCGRVYCIVFVYCSTDSLSHQYRNISRVLCNPYGLLRTYKAKENFDIPVFHMNFCIEPLIPSSERLVIMELAPKGEGE